MDPLVKIISVRDAVDLDVATLQPTRAKLVTYMVGQNGPFTLRYQASEYSQATVEAAIQKEVDTLRALHAIPPASV